MIVKYTCLLEKLRSYILNLNQEFAMSCESEVAQLCPTLCDPMDSSLPGSAFRGIFQARILEWAAISFSRGSSQTRDGTWVSCIASGHIYSLESDSGERGSW